MLILIGLGIVVPLSIAFKDSIKKYATALYILCVLLSLGIIYLTMTEAVVHFSRWTRDWIWSLFANGVIATALFIVVMFIGAFSKGSFVKKRLMPIRAELSIMASILTLGHNISFGLVYFVFFFKKPEALPTYQLIATISTMILMVIMIPLFITSFYSIRNKMSAVKWKKMQRWAYLFYALTYVHVLLLFIPLALKERPGYFFSIVVYTLIFGIYAGMRITLAYKEKGVLQKALVWIVVVALGSFVVAYSVPNLIVKVEKPKEEVFTLDKSKNTQSEKNDENQDVQNEEKDVSEDEKQPEDENTDSKVENDENKDNNEVEEPKSDVDKKDKAPEQKPEKKDNTEQQKPEKKPETKQKPKQNKQPEKKDNKPQQNQGNKPKEDKKPQEQSKPEPKKEEPKKKYKDGTFTGRAKGYNGDVVLSVVIENDEIIVIKIEDHMEDEPYWTDCKAMIPRMLGAQSSKVSSIGGATVSSDAMKKAVEQALSQARN